MIWLLVAVGIMLLVGVFLVGLSTGLTWATVYQHGETNQKIKMLRENRIKMEALRHEIEMVKTTEEALKLVDRLNELQRQLEEEGE